MWTRDITDFGVFHNDHGFVEYDITTLKRGISLSKYYKGNMAHMNGNITLKKGSMALTKGNLLEGARWNTERYPKTGSTIFYMSTTIPHGL